MAAFPYKGIAKRLGIPDLRIDWILKRPPGDALMSLVINDLFLNQLAQSHSDGNGALILAVGDLSAWNRMTDRRPARGPVAYAEFEELDENLLALLTPRLVVSPLLSRRFDCIDLAVRLVSLGFGGKYRVIDTSLPDPALIVREVRALAPGLDFAVTEFGPEALSP